MTDKERINEIINSSNMSARRFGEYIGIKTPQVLYDIIKGRNGISKDLAEKISAKCVNYNIAWLLTGEGEMLKTIDPVSQDSLKTDNSFVLSQQEIIKSQQETINRQSKIIETLTSK